ncbi:unnamed protein product [Schistocephalus solidus]|uniref:Exportin-5 domain-containing protein n=1 Tax=Schistocephalus solidus TaxID=70667 RepID=A0A183SLJ3_SCHSO|nr:unnamed protein product [Schistocephalus solidus]
MDLVAITDAVGKMLDPLTPNNIRAKCIQEAYFEPEAIRMIRAALQFLSGFFEWAPIASFMDWKPPKDFPFLMQTVPSVYLMLNLLRINAFKVEVAELLSVLIVKKRSLFTGPKYVETTSVYSAFVAFSEDQTADPITFLLDTTRITCSLETYTPESGVFLQRLTEFLVFLGVQVVENWPEISNRETSAQARAEGTFALLFQAVLLTASHPTRIASAQAVKFFKSVLESSSHSLLECISKYMPQLLELWSEHCILRNYPSPSERFAAWVQAHVEKDEYRAFLTGLRTEVKTRLWYPLACAWPAAVLTHLLDWHTKLLSRQASPPDFLYPSQPFINPTCTLALQWDALAFITDKLLSASLTKRPDRRHSLGAAKESPNLAPESERTSALQMLAAYIDKNAGLFSSDTTAVLPLDPFVRRNYLSVLCSLVAPLHDRANAVLLQLLMQHFSTLRYDPSLQSADAAPNVIGRLVKLRSIAVKDLHINAASNIFRLVRSHASSLEPFYDAFCSELSDIWTNRPCGLSEQCMLLETVVFLTLRLHCPLEEQQAKLKLVLSTIFAEWLQPDGVLWKISQGGAASFIEYFGLDRDLQAVEADPNFAENRTAARLNVQRSVTATCAIVRRLREALSLEQLQQVCLPLLEPIVRPVFQLLRCINQLCTPFAIEKMHPSMRITVEPRDIDKMIILGLNKKSREDRMAELLLVHVLCPRTLPLKALVKVDAVSHNYLNGMRGFISKLTSELLLLTHLLIDGTALFFYAIPSEHLSVLICNYVCVDVDSLPDHRLFNLLYHVVIPYVRLCPTAYIESALVPIVPMIIDAFFQKVNGSWSVIKIVDKEEMDDQEASDEIFREETLRSLSAGLVELVRIFLNFNGAKPSKFADTSSKEEFATAISIAEDGDDEMEDRGPTVGQGALEMGAVAAVLLAQQQQQEQAVTGVVVDSSVGTLSSVFTLEGPLARIVCWLSLAITWPDSRICSKAATLLGKILEFVFKKDKHTMKRQMSGELAGQLLIGGLHALRTNGQYQSECAVPLLTFLSRVYSSTEEVAVSNQIDPLLVTALSSCQTDVTPASIADRVQIPVSEQFRERLSLTSLEPLKRQAGRGKVMPSALERNELAFRALTDLFSAE